MKRLIATACSLIIFGFSVALANAEDTTTSNPAAPDTASAMSTETTTTHTDDRGNTMTSTAKWKSMKTCTDASGVKYYKGKTGFDNCVADMKRSHKKDDQMGGVLGDDPTTVDKSVTPDSSSPTSNIQVNP